MVVRLAFGALLMALTALLLIPQVSRLLARRGAVPVLQGAFVCSRLAAWIVTYGLLGDIAVHSDLALYYTGEARSAAGGAIPYLDFPSSYGPLFAYVLAAPWSIWPHSAAVALPLVGFEIVAVLLLSRLARTQRDVPEQMVARTLFVYTLNPAALYWSGMLAYNSSVVLLFWVYGVARLLRTQPGAAGVSLGASVLVGKFLGILAGPVWFGCARQRVRVLLTTGAVSIAVFLLLRQNGIDLLLPLRREGGRATSGNLWFLIGSAVPVDLTSTPWQAAPLAVLAAGLAALTLFFVRAWHRPPNLIQLAAGISSCGWLFMLLSRKGYPHYTPMFLLFFVLVLAARSTNRWWPVLLALVGAIGVVEPGLWNAIGQPNSLSGADGRVVATAWALLAADLALIATTVWALWLSITHVRSTDRVVEEWGS